MQFKHPEVLYALLLLLIPILIHLFQLRRFQKIDFTNVAFLRKVTIQTRKSSQLKKWITLLLRLAAIACIVLAFAQPYIASKTAMSSNKETVLYIDNSFSMQAKGANGPLLQRALQQLFELGTGAEKISWFTNNSSHQDVSVQDFKSEVLSIPYVQNQLTPQEVLLKAEQLFSTEPNTVRRLLYISDLQISEALPEIPSDFQVELVQARPVASNNISIDTAFVAAKNSGTTQLDVVISGQGEVNESVPVSLFNRGTLIAKIAADLSDQSATTISFDIEDPSDFRGRLSINDPNLLYDNSLFFSFSSPEKIKVLSINEASPDFLARLFDQEEFDYQQEQWNALSYDDIPEQHFVILNEIATVPPSLVTALASYVNNGGGLVIIPAGDGDISSYNNLLANLGLGSIARKRTAERKITGIVFDHPLYASVFEKRVVNFQYPKVNAFYELNSNASAALQFEDGAPFILQRGNVYMVTAPINSENSNFQSSPLIVPSLYNMATQSLPLPNLYFETNTTNTFAVPVTLLQDEILTIRDSLNGFIPLQQTKASQVMITTTDEPRNSGNYEVVRENETLEIISYNHNRTESVLQYHDADEWTGTRLYSSVEDMFSTITEENSIRSFWKWFVIFAIVFLIMEMLVLKFFKK